MSEKILKTGISQGDINGISYELILKTYEDIRMLEASIPILYGSSKILAYHRKAMDLQPINFNTINNLRDAGTNRLNIVNCGNEETVVEFSKPSPEGEAMAKQALERAVEDLKNKQIDTLVIAPSTIDEISCLTNISGVKPMKILISDSLRIALSSEKIPLSEVAGNLSIDLLVEQLKTLHQSLVHDFMLTLPRIAVLSLNPGKGIKEQQYGREENEIIIPAIKKADEEKITCFGPYSAEDFFSSDDYQKFDAILALYYDQGVAPFRLLSQNRGAVLYAGLPHVVTAPDLGVSFSKAGKNEILETPFRDAIFLAADIFKTRHIDAEIHSNPLRKQYYEKGADNEKLDLTKDED
jgi:4-hydroxythreonine-4-phosphate dehydrogenase